MKTTIATLLLISIIFVIYLFILGKKSATGQAPGLIENRLTPCPKTPNCICSEYNEDIEHYIEPLKITRDIDSAALTTLIESLGGEVKNQSEDYISAIFVSRLFGFVDDFEIRLDTQNGLIHFRSASRVGQSDLGVNQKRVEKIKELLNAAE